MKTLLVDLYDTIAWVEWPTLSERLAFRLGVDADRLRRAFELTRNDRGTGRFGSVAGDLAAVATACGIAADHAFLDRLAAEVVEFVRRGVHLYDDVLPQFHRWRSTGTRIAVVSNCDHATRPVVDALGLERAVDTVVLSFEVASLKPEAEIFREALHRLRSDAGDAVFVDDQARYLDGAAALGLRTFRIARQPFFGEASDAGTHPVIAGLGELPSWLLQ